MNELFYTKPLIFLHQVDTIEIIVQEENNMRYLASIKYI